MQFLGNHVIFKVFEEVVVHGQNLGYPVWFGVKGLQFVGSAEEAAAYAVVNGELYVRRGTDSVASVGLLAGHRRVACGVPDYSEPVVESAGVRRA